MKKLYFICVVAVLSLYFCNGESSDGNSGFFDYDLRGTWSYFEEAKDWPWDDSRSGTLVITIDSIKISGDIKPLNGFTKDSALKGYSEKPSGNREQTLGNLFIQDRGTWQEGVAFNLWETADNEQVLTIGTGNEQKTLKRVKPQ
jgi:hypothetical protein